MTMIEKLADAMDAADTGHRLDLTRLVDGVSTYTVTCMGETREFEETDDAYAWIGERKRSVKIRAVLTALREPDAGMLRHGAPDGTPFSTLRAELIFTAMIDHILQEPQP